MMRSLVLAAVRRVARLRGVLRWRYVLPRAACVAATVLTVRWGLDPALRALLVAGGEAALGAKVDVAELTTSLRAGRLTIAGFAAANPSKPMANLASADSVQLDVDLPALLRKRLVIRGGEATGLVFDGARETSGALAPVEPQEPAGPSALDPLLAEAGEAAAAWLDAVEGRVVEDLQAQLATPRVLRELQDRWQAEYAELSARALRLRDQSREIERDFREAKKNPLRNAARFEELQQQLAAAQSELKQTLADLQALPAQTQADRQAVDAARRQDEQLLRRAVQVAKTDGGQLSQYLLGETAHGYLTQAVWWIDAARRWTPSSRIERPARARGTTVLFVNRPQPQCLVQRLALSGTARWGGQPLQWTGELTDAASQPRLHPQPLQLAVELHGAMDGQLTVTLDRRGEAPLDTLVLDCPRLPVDATSLGAADKLAVAVAPGDAALAAHIQLAGRALDGEITLRQATSLTMQTAAIRDDRIAAMLAESLAEVDRIEAHVTLSGTLDRPRVAVQSNLGPQLASGIHGAMRRYLTDRRDRLAAKVQAGADEQLARLQTQRQQAQAELMAKLGENQELFGQLATLMGGGGALNPAAAVPQLGSKLNLERLTR